MKYYTYAHYTADTTELFYIGKGTQVVEHTKATRASSSKGRNKYWNNKIKKHGGFTYVVLARWETEKEAFEHEILLIKLFKGLGVCLCNLTDGGEGMLGHKQSEENKKKNSESKKGNTFCKGRKMSDRNRDILMTLHKGIPKTLEHRKNISIARIGLKVPVIWKAIKCITTNITYPSVTEAALKTGCDPSHIVKCCKGKLNKTKKMEFAYAGN